MACARPRSRPEDIIRNTISKNQDVTEEFLGNNTEKRGKDSKNTAPKNSEITKAIDDYYDYEDEEYFDDPIIVIKFKRDTTAIREVVEDTLRPLSKNKKDEKYLVRNFIRWFKQHSLE